jgi:hypothetical protein
MRVLHKVEDSASSEGNECDTSESGGCDVSKGSQQPISCDGDQSVFTKLKSTWKDSEIPE